MHSSNSHNYNTNIEEIKKKATHTYNKNQKLDINNVIT